MSMRAAEDEERSTLINESVDQAPGSARETPSVRASLQKLQAAVARRRQITCRRVLIAFAIFIIGLFLLGAINPRAKKAVQSQFSVGEVDESGDGDSDPKNYLLDEDTSESITPDAADEIAE